MSIIVGGLQVFIRDDVERFTANFRGAATNVGQQSERMRKAVGGVSDSMERMNRAAASSSPNAFRALALSALRAEDNVKRLETALLAVSALAGGFAGAFVLRGLTQAADAYTNIQNRLSTITKTEAERVAVNQAIFEIAQRTRTEYGATATLFARIGTATDKLGASTADVLRVVETVQKSFSVAGSTTQEAQSAAIQLAQGLASGKLQGDELKSILENNIPLARLLARELAGGDIGKLRELGEKGALDPKSVFNAILNGSAGIDAAFERTGQTTSQAILKLSNALTAFVGKMDDSIGATAKLAAALGSLADNFAPIASGALLVAAALTSVFLSNKLLSGASAVRGKLTSLMAEQTANLKQLEEQAKATQAAMLRSVFSSEPAQTGGKSARDIAMQQEGRSLRAIARDEEALKKLNEERVRLANQLASTTASTSRIEEGSSKRRLAAEVRLAETISQRQALEAKAAGQPASDRSRMAGFYSAAFDLEDARRKYDESINAESKLRQEIIARREAAVSAAAVTQQATAKEIAARRQIAALRNRADELNAANTPYRETQSRLYGSMFDIQEARSDLDQIKRLAAENADDVQKYRNLLQSSASGPSRSAYGDIISRLEREGKEIETVQSQATSRLSQATAQYNAARSELEKVPAKARQKVADGLAAIERDIAAQSRIISAEEASRLKASEEAKKKVAAIDGELAQVSAKATEVRRAAGQKLMVAERAFSAEEEKLNAKRLSDAEKTSSQLTSLAQREAAERTKINNLNAAEQAAIAKRAEQAAAQRASVQGRLNEIVRQSSATGVGLAFQREGASESVASRMIANQNAMAVSQRNVAAETLAASRAAEEFARANSLVSRSLGVARAAGLSLYGFLGGPWGVALNAATVALGIWGYRAEAEAARVRRAQDLIAKALGSAAEQGDVVAKRSVYDRQKDALLEDIKSLTEQAAQARSQLVGSVTSALGPTLLIPGERFAALQNSFPGLVSAFESGKISVNQFKAALTELGVPAPILAKINSEIVALSKPVEQAQSAIEVFKKQLTDLDGQTVKINVDLVQRRIDGAFLDAQKVGQSEADRESRSQQAFLTVSQNATAELILRQRLAKARGDEAEKVRELAQEIVRETNISYDAAVKQAQAEVAAAKGKKDSAKASREAATEQKRLDKAYKDSLDTLREKAAEARLEVESFRESKQSQYEAKILLEEYNKLAEKGVAITKEKALALQQQAAATAKDMVAADALQKAISAADDVRSTLGSTTGGFLNDIANGTTLVEGLRNAFVSLRTAILNALGNQIIASMFGAQGTPFNFFGTPVPGFAAGGDVRGPGTSRSDSIPAMLSDGEFVVNAQAARRHSRLLEAINSGRPARMATGGWADRGARSLASRHSSPMLRTIDQSARDNGGRKPVPVNVTISGAAGNSEVKALVASGVAQGLREYESGEDARQGRRQLQGASY